MPIKIINTTRQLEEIEWCIQDLAPLGYLTILGAREGLGKTLLLAMLAWQITRQSGSFLNLPVTHGSVMFINTDAVDGEARSVRNWLISQKSQFPDGNMDLITIIESDGSGLTQDDFREIAILAQKTRPVCIIIDSMMGSFPTINPNKLEQILPLMQNLSKIANQTGAALIVSDHLPKSTNPEDVFNRGILGSVAKTAQARSVLMLTQSNDLGNGEKILQLKIQKASYARSGYSISFKIAINKDAEFPSAVVEIVDAQRFSKIRSIVAQAKIRDSLVNAASQPVDHRELVEIAKSCGLQARSAQAAVREATRALGSDILAETLERRGSPKTYTYIATNQKNDVSDREKIVAEPDATNEGLVITSW